MSQEEYNQLKRLPTTYTPAELVDTLTFEESLHRACQLLNNDAWEESLQIYAAAFLEELRKKYPEKWQSSWRYDAFLGFVYDVILNYDERYAAYKRAMDRVKPVPPELLVALAGCCWSPGDSPITEKEAVLLVKEAIKTTPYVEGVRLLRGLYKSMGNIKEQQYWEKVLEEVELTGTRLPPLDEFPSLPLSWSAKLKLAFKDLWKRIQSPR